MIAGLLVAVAVVRAEGEIWEEDDREVLIRSERGTKNNKGTVQLLLYIMCIAILHLNFDLYILSTTQNDMRS